MLPRYDSTTADRDESNTLLVDTLCATSFAQQQLDYWRNRTKVDSLARWLREHAFEAYTAHCEQSGQHGIVTRCSRSARHLEARLIEQRGMAASVDVHYLSFIITHPAIAASLFLAQCLVHSDYADLCTHLETQSDILEYGRHVCNIIIDDWINGSESEHFPHFVVQAMWLNCLDQQNKQEGLVGEGICNNNNQLRDALNAILCVYCTTQK